MRFGLLFFSFFCLFALTAQRGLGWGDSGEFQHLILNVGQLALTPDFVTHHPLYLALCKAICSTPFHTALVSSFFGALAVALFYLCSRNFRLSVVFGLSHALWWLSCVTETYTLSLVLFELEVFSLLKWQTSKRGLWLFVLAIVNAVHLEVHNLALLGLPVYGIVWIWWLRDVEKKYAVKWTLAAILAWLMFASYWIYAFFTVGPLTVLVGKYGGQVCGVLPRSMKIPLFNWALAGMSFVPVLFCIKKIRFSPVAALFAIHFVFWVRYFIISQFTFVLPSLFLSYLLFSEIELSRRKTALLCSVQILLPVCAFFVLKVVGFPEWYWSHPGRDNAAYFALPWKFNDKSADKCAELQNGEWSGYYNPENLKRKGDGKK
jgi:hypothetical protein